MTPNEIKQLADVLVIHASKLCRDRHHQAPNVFGEALKALGNMSVMVESAMELCNTLDRLEASRKANAKRFMDAYEQTSATAHLGDFHA